MSSRTQISVALVACLFLAACGGSSTGADGDVSPTLNPDTIPLGRLTRSTTDIDPSNAPATIAAPTSPSTLATVAPIETLALASDACPNGSWWVDPAGLGPLGAFGAFDDIAMTSVGRFVVDIGDGNYTITADGFSLDLVSSTSEIGISVSGATTGSLTTGAELLTFLESSFEMDAEVTVDGEQVAGEFIEEAFHQTFGSATVPYTCNADGTLTITYDAPTGPAPAIHVPV